MFIEIFLFFYVFLLSVPNKQFYFYPSNENLVLINTKHKVLEQFSNA